MKRFLSIAVGCLLALAPITFVVSPALLLTSGCASLHGDPVVIRSEQGIKIAFDTIDTFLQYEHTANASGQLGPGVRDIAEKLRINAPRWIEGANVMLKAYKDNRTIDNKANLLTAIAVLQAGADEATKQLVGAKEP